MKIRNEIITNTIIPYIVEETFINALRYSILNIVNNVGKIFLLQKKISTVIVYKMLWISIKGTSIRNFLKFLWKFVIFIITWVDIYNFHIYEYSESNRL